MKRMMKKPAATLLEYALLGMLHQKPSSGYDVRKIFAETAMGNFSDSPGSIYPALRRLQDRKLLSAQIEHGSGMRRRRVLRPTAAGLSELRTWVRSPMGPASIARRLDEWMLRFLFCDGVLGEGATIKLLEAFEAALKNYLPPLQEFLLTNGPKMSLAARLALDNGVLSYEAQLRWASHAIKTYKRKLKSI